MGHHHALLVKSWLFPSQDNATKTCYVRWKIIVAMEWDGANMALVQRVVGLLEAMDHTLVLFQRVYPGRDWKLVQSMWEEVQQEVLQ